MDFRAAARHLAGPMDDSLDVTMQDASLPAGQIAWQPDVKTDGMDPASPGGPSPYNGAEPFSKPVTSNPEWLDPQDHNDGHMPYTPGPDVDTTTLHRARRDSYQRKEMRSR